MISSIGERRSGTALIFLILVLALLLPRLGTPEEQIPKDQAARFEALLKEMDAAMQSGGLDGLKAWARTNKSKIADGFIAHVEGLGLNLESEDLLFTAEALALETGDIKLLAELFLANGGFYENRKRYDEALVRYRAAEYRYGAIGDPSGQGRAGMSIGDVYLLRGDRDNALSAYEKALPFLDKAKDDFGQGYVYKCQGDIFRESGRPAEALALYESALPFFGKAKYPSGQGAVLRNEGEILFKMREPVKALAMYEKAFSSFSIAKDLVGQGDMCLRQGDIQAALGERAEALALYEKALSFYAEAGNDPGQGNAYHGKGEIFLLTSDNDKALEMFSRALSFFEKAKYLQGSAQAYEGEGDVFAQIGEFAKAQEMYEKAMPLFKEAQSPSGQGNALQGQGNLYFLTGEKTKALAMYEEALHLYESANDLDGKGNALEREGDVYFFSGEIAKALELYEKALSLFKNIPNLLGEANIYKAEGNIYQNARENAKAREMFEEALPIYIRLHDPLGQGNVYRSAGDLYVREGDPSKARDMYEKALDCFKNASDQLGRGIIFERLGEILLGENDTAKAQDMFDKALSIYEELKDPIGLGNAYKNEGYIDLMKGEDVKALAALDKAISQYHQAQSPESLALTLAMKAAVLARRGAKVEALNLYEESLRFFERVRAGAGVAELKKAYLQKFYGPYDDAALFMLSNAYPERAFRVVESMKARSFLDMLAESLVSVDKGLDPALKERRDALTAKLSAAAKAISRALKSDKDKIQALTSEQDKLQAEFDALQTEIRLKNPAYAAIRYPEPVGLDALQKNVLRPHEVLVEYYLSQEKASAFIVSPSAFKAVELPAGSKAIRAAVAADLDWIVDPKFKPDDELGRLTAGSTVYDQLIKPISSQLPDDSTLIIVPDDILARLPFESLVAAVDSTAKRPIYLLERYPIKYIQSASILSYLRTQFKQTGATDTFIGFGDPVYDYENFQKQKPEYGMEGYESTPGAPGGAVAELNKGRFAREGGSLKRLENSGLEVAEISELFQAKGSAGDKIKACLRETAAEENAKAPSMADYGYIHFSCHGLLGESFQALVLSQIPGAKEDGFLTLAEIMNCNYNARLVVLSACKTGQGKEERGEGVTGLTRAVMYGGTPAAVVSLWNVSDAATRELMVRFYRHMIKDGLPKDEALRQAKLEMLRSDQRRWITESTSIPANRPFFWAAFVLYGE
jgi:CHAT domain-containing protein/predicted negative regulator of RcsB-dependent stress response